MEENKIKTFKDLFAWQEGHKLVLEIYELTKSFPKEELFGLVSQMRRAVISITSNIAEGFGRRTSKDKVHFYKIAIGSLLELHNQMIISKDLGYVSIEHFRETFDQSTKVNKIICGLINKVSAY